MTTRLRFFLRHIRTGALVAATAAAAAAEPIDPAGYVTASPEELRLGQALFYDPILSGNRSVSCASCHHPRFATGDALSLGLGDGGIGLGPERVADPENPPEQRIPRNAPPLFNVGHSDVTAMFADGRIEVDPGRPSGLRTPLEDEMVEGFANLLSAQTMFPVLSPDEMAGHYQENDVAKAVRQGRLTGPGGAWDIIAGRVAAIPAYRDAFAAVRPEIAAGREIGFTDISDVIAAFVAVEWRADASPYDAWLRGEDALTPEAEAGRALFFGTAGCGGCHSGPLLSDQRYHAMGAPQMGPGKAERFERHQRDIGRMRVTGRAGDAYAFRTPMLRNVTRTGPWGHAGAHDDLRAFLRDHAEPEAGLARYMRGGALPKVAGIAGDWAILDDPAERAAIAAAIRTPPRPLSELELDRLMAFLAALEDPVSLKGRLGVPETVPSGLPLDR